MCSPQQHFLVSQPYFMSETLHASHRVPFGLGRIPALDAPKVAFAPSMCLEWLADSNLRLETSISALWKGGEAL